MTGFRLYHSYVSMNVTNRKQSLVKSEIRHYFIRLTICSFIYWTKKSNKQKQNKKTPLWSCTEIFINHLCLQFLNTGRIHLEIISFLFFYWVFWKTYILKWATHFISILCPTLRLDMSLSSNVLHNKCPQLNAHNKCTLDL